MTIPLRGFGMEEQQDYTMIYIEGYFLKLDQNVPEEKWWEKTVSAMRKTDIYTLVEVNQINQTSSYYPDEEVAPGEERTRQTLRFRKDGPFVLLNDDMRQIYWPGTVKEFIEAYDIPVNFPKTKDEEDAGTD